MTDHTHLLFEDMRSFIRYLPYHVVPAKCASIMSIYLTLVNVYVDLLVFTRIAGTS